MKLLALDFGGTFVKQALSDESGNLSDKKKTPAPSDSLDHFLSFIQEQADLCRGRIEGIAISMPGFINSDTGYVKAAGSYGRIIREMPLAEMIRERTGLKTTIENDAKAAGYAELWQGNLQHVNNAAALIIGSGLGGCIIMDGRIRKGSRMTAGEFSGILLEPGKYGFENFLAGYAGMSAFLRSVAEKKHMDPALFEIAGNADDTVHKISGREVFEWIEQGDPETMEAYQKWLEILAWALFNLKQVIDPDRFVIGGGVSENPRLIPDLQAAFDRYVEPVRKYGEQSVPIVACRFANDANLIGAVGIYLHHEGCA